MNIEPHLTNIKNKLFDIVTPNSLMRLRLDQEKRSVGAVIDLRAALQCTLTKKASNLSLRRLRTANIKSTFGLGCILFGTLISAFAASHFLFNSSVSLALSGADRTETEIRLSALLIFGIASVCIGYFLPKPDRGTPINPLHSSNFQGFKTHEMHQLAQGFAEWAESKDIYLYFKASGDSFLVVPSTLWKTPYVMTYLFGTKAHRNALSATGSYALAPILILASDWEDFQRQRDVNSVESEDPNISATLEQVNLKMEDQASSINEDQGASIPEEQINSAAERQATATPEHPDSFAIKNQAIFAPVIQVTLIGQVQGPSIRQEQVNSAPEDSITSTPEAHDASTTEDLVSKKDMSPPDRASKKMITPDMTSDVSIREQLRGPGSTRCYGLRLFIDEPEYLQKYLALNNSRNQFTKKADVVCHDILVHFAYHPDLMKLFFSGTTYPKENLDQMKEFDAKIHKILQISSQNTEGRFKKLRDKNWLKLEKFIEATGIVKNEDIIGRIFAQPE